MSAILPLTQLSEFNLPDNNATEKVSRSMPSKTCSLDPIPTHVVKNHLNLLLPAIQSIIISSLSSGTLPTQLKISQVKPKLKKNDLDKNLYSNYRPIANIAFVSKVIEKIVASQVHTHLRDAKLFPTLQSAYRQYHSTETAMIKVTNDILRAIDDYSDVILVLLDLSAAFDTLGHQILLSRLKSYFGFTGSVLQWFRSYLTNRSQKVVISEVASSLRQLEFGVPQGSILRPLLFVLYMAPLQDVISRHGLDCMFFADDTQLYIAVNPKKPSSELDRLSSCVEDIIKWNTDNFLLCNPTKTEVMHLTSRFIKNHSPPLQFLISGDTTIKPSEQVRDLGVILDKHMNMTLHINDTCKKILLSIKSIGRIRKYVSQESLKKLVHALVLSRLDYSNSLLYRATRSDLDKLQRTMNSAARLITGIKKYEHISDALRNLHWLPIECRIKFNILLTVYKSLNGLAPDYLSALIDVRRPTSSLRSSDKLLLNVPKINTVTYGQRAFSYVAATLWNSIPDNIRNSVTVEIFKTRLKTFLFKEAYNSSN